MLLVLVEIRSRVGPLKELTEALPDIVAKGLTVPGTDCELLPHHVGVVFNETTGNLDQNIPDVLILVWAQTDPELLEELDVRRHAIAKEISLHIPDYGMEVRIGLVPTSYERMEASPVPGSC